MTARTRSKPAWLAALVHERDIEPTAAVAATGLALATAPRTSRPKPLPPFDKDLQCKHCGKAFRRVCNYREHQRVHSNEYKFACSVAGCGRKFMWRSSIQAHLRSHQSKLQKRRVPIAKPPRLPSVNNVMHKAPPLSPVSPLPSLTSAMLPAFHAR